MKVFYCIIINIIRKLLVSGNLKYKLIAITVPFIISISALIIQTVPSLGDLAAVLLISGYASIVSYGCKYYANQAKLLATKLM